VSDLHKLLAKVGSLGEQRTQKLSYDLISALYYLHSHRILHRDLKPPNILLDKNYKAKLCDFGLARNMTLGTQILTSIKGTPLYMAPELLEGRGYGHEADLWSLGCIIYEMLAGESPFNTRSILHLMQLIRYGNVKWPSFLSSSCISFLKGLLINNPAKRMGWDEILEHKFVKGNILILSSDKSISDSPFTRPRDKAQHAATIANITRLKKQEVTGIEDVMSSRDSIKVNLNLQSDMDETDNEEIALLKQELDPIDTSSEALKHDPEPLKIPQQFQFHNMHNFQFDAPKVHNIANVQPVAENSNMVMHRFMDNVDPELQHFLMAPMVPPIVSNHFQGLVVKDVERKASIKKSTVKTQSDGLSTDVSSVPVETEEWLQFIFKSMQEVLDGDLEIYKQENMMTMIVGLLRDSKFNSKLIDYVVQIICLPYALDLPKSMIEDIDKMYLQLKLVPNLVYASKLLCSKKNVQVRSS
jgi:fused